MPHDDLIPAPSHDLILAVARELTEQDILALADAGPINDVPPLQKVRTIHHRQAMLIAEGKKLTEVARIVGSTPQRLGQLMRDPTFKELVSYYETQVHDSHRDEKERVEGKLLDVAELALDELHGRLEGGPPKLAMDTDELRRLAELGLDRTVAPPKTAQSVPSPPANITLNFAGNVALSRDKDKAA